MRTELEVLRDIAAQSRFVLARRPFEEKDDPDDVAWRWLRLAQLHAELVWIEDHARLELCKASQRPWTREREGAAVDAYYANAFYAGGNK